MKISFIYFYVEFKYTFLNPLKLDAHRKSMGSNLKRVGKGARALPLSTDIHENH